MLATTACGKKTEKFNRKETMVTCKSGMEDGRDHGTIRFVRYSYYGTSNYENAIEARKFHRDNLGEIVSEIFAEERETGKPVYWFRAATVAG